MLATLDPLRPVVFVLVLRTERARINAVALLAGWAFSLTVLFVVGFIIGGGAVSREASSHNATRVSALELVLAIALLVLAARRWRTRNDATAHSLTPDAVLRRLDGLNPRTAGLMGVLIQPRTLTIAAALVVARDGSGFISLLIGFGVFAVFSTAALLGIFAYDVWRHENAQSTLTRLVTRLEQSAPTIFTALLAVGGGYLLIDGIRGLASR